ncbi:MAG: efflux RND transporter periplasmic adaptor subunit [Armatimonadota bacterium]|nr:efflux RND transporter periplasmic adaptor subunit [Armatimonadota bacterium]
MLAVLLLAAGALVYRDWQARAGPVPVVVGEVRRQPLAASFIADGIVQARTVHLAPKLAGRIAAILVQEGQAVRAGQPLLRLDDRELQAGVEEALAAVATAQTARQQARMALALARERAAAEEAQARAQLAAATARLDRVLAGTRPEEIARAEQQLAQARAARQAAEAAARRAQALYAAGAIARAELDETLTRLEAAAAQEEAARQTVALLAAGASREEIAEARAAADAARASLARALTARGEVGLRQADVAAAHARLAQARATLVRARALLADASVRAPFDAVVASVAVDVGEIVSPTTPVITLVDPRDVWVDADVTDEDATKVRVGLEVTVTVPAYPGRRFRGRVTDLAPAARTRTDLALRTRIVRVKVRLLDTPALTPGLEADVEGTATVVPSALVIPADALAFREDRTVVFVVERGIARVREVHTGYATVALAEVTGGLREGELVVVDGKDRLVDGRRVRVVGTVGP